ncbi:MAG TPA: pilus assembly PilX N-terminal domain-containing protein [Thermoanaerobaculia bacterium]|nr:pilus assembly PilX N-terminal domain-containing protein [Thermoanaerobaculia bacterium]
MTTRHEGERGSALLVSLMVMVGLSLLGLGFVAISESESAIAVNERNAAQVQGIAETGARAAVEWFQDPQWARNQNFMPVNNDAVIAAGGFKRQRVVGSYAGVYKPAPAVLLLDRPYRPAPQNRFFGTEDTADLELNRTNAAAQLTAINTALFGADSRTAGRIEEIKMYAPPMVGGTLVNGFWRDGERYGLATVMVTAEKWSRATGGVMLSRRIVRVVVGEFPVPVPGGPIQTQAAINVGGNFGVHWGDITSFTDIAAGGATLPAGSFPWANPYDRPAFERGYDEIVWPVAGAPGAVNWLNEIVGKSYPDPWFGSRSRAANGICGANCGTYAQNSNDVSLVYSGFANQTTNTYPVSKLVNFPDIQYDVWKRIALAGRGMRGVNYFTWDSATGGFKKNAQGTARPAAYWVNTLNGARLGAGIYFFDTRDRQRPRADGSNLTPNLSWNSADFNAPFRMEGFIYLNAAEYGTTGAGNCCPADLYNMPPEIFRDIGYRAWDNSTTDWAVDVDGNPLFADAANSQWDFQDLNANGRFDLVLTAANQNFQSNDPGNVNHANERRVITWGPGCTVGACSEPHEPYINFVYPAAANGPVVARWETPGAETRRPKRRGVNCNAASPPEDCTSNGYDDPGGMVNLSVLVDGILFNEGSYRSTGNAAYFGAVLIRRNVSANGTPDVYFDARLLKGTPPRNMPRVTIYSLETDEAI